LWMDPRLRGDDIHFRVLEQNLPWVDYDNA
jgi:hypothetical protein